jgi:hypothetical protein
VASPSSNPYAPPDPSYKPGTFVAPLPEGVRRFKLDPARLRVVARSVILRRTLPLFGVIFFIVVGAVLAWSGPSVTVLPSVGVMLAVVVVQVVRQARVPKEHVATYELLLGERMMRRTLAKTLPAEVLRQEVTAIYETRFGLWVMCAAPLRALFVIAAVERFDVVRAELATWHPIEARGGLQAWRVERAVARQQGERRDPAAGAPSIDPTLAAELANLRAASSDAWKAFPAPNLKRTNQRFRLYGLLLVMFFVVWKVLEVAR